MEKIWEGTVTVLSLDGVRAASKPGVLDAFLDVSILINSSFACSHLVRSG